MNAPTAWIESGHLFVSWQGGKWLLDTGSPDTLHTKRASANRGAHLPLDALMLDDFLPLDRMDGLLGMDELATSIVRLDLKKGAFALVSEPGETPSLELAVGSLSGLPLVEVFVGGRSRTMIWDTGAQLGYVLDEQDVSTAEEVGMFTDFHPYSHPPVFDVVAHKVPVSLGPEQPTFPVRMAMKPEFIDSFGYGILGLDLLEHFVIELDMPRSRMRLWRHPEP